MWGDAAAPDGVRRTRSRSRTPPGVRRNDSDYEATFRLALRESVDQLITSAAAHSSTEAPRLPSMTSLAGSSTVPGDFHVSSPLRLLGDSGLEVLEKDGGSIFVVNAEKVSSSLLLTAVSACRQICPVFSQQWVKSHSRWNDNPNVQIVDLPGGVSAGARGHNSKIRIQALAVACVTSHYAFAVVDAGAECPIAEFDHIVQVACEALRNSATSGTVWKGRKYVLEGSLH